MKNTRTKRALALFLALLMVISAAFTLVSNAGIIPAGPEGVKHDLLIPDPDDPDEGVVKNLDRVWYEGCVVPAYDGSYWDWYVNCSSL